MHGRKKVGLALLVAALIAPVGDAAAEDRGFQLNRYEPTSAGSWFFGVEHPWYSSTRYFAGGITLNYANNPLVYGTRDADGNFTRLSPVVEHSLLGHVDLAGSFLDRVQISATLPVTFMESGQTQLGVSPISGVAVGDPRVGLMVRLFGQPDKDAVSMSLAAHVWIPIGMATDKTGDQGVRFAPKVIIGGVAADHLRWSFNAAFLYRGDATLSAAALPAGNTVGHELQLGLGLAYTNTARTLHIGPEVLLGTQIASNAFEKDYTSLEALLGFNYLIADVVMIGAGVGGGFLREPGTPDVRALLRIAYAPMKREAAKPVAPPDRDNDGVADDDDKCPDTPKGANPDPRRPGCPMGDRDRDGVLDDQDQCPDEPQGERPDAEKKGCPMGDRDKDGVLDGDDQCPDVAKGEHPDPKKAGCPDTDTDKDGVYDSEDQCVDKAAGPKPDPDKKGCPLPDRDGDTVVDPEDACPDKFGAPSPDPKKNGCPGLVEVKEGQIRILQQVFFATNKDVILKKSFPVLQAVADVLVAQPHVKKIAVEGHTDIQGKREMNLDLSDRRAKSVMKWLVDHKIAAERLEAHGYGPDKPIADNKTAKGRALNRRVEFHILDN